MKVLVACEFSGIVRDAFRRKGHDAVSCDLEPTENPGNGDLIHFQCDVRTLFKYHWDIMIAHPPCTDIAVSGARWFPEKRTDGRQQEAIRFFMEMVNAPIDRIAIENPIGIMSTEYRKPDQIIQPWWFGDDASKKTCLWLKNLPLLKETNRLPGDNKTRRANQTASGQNKLGPSPDRAKLRSVTYPGIALAMSNQWSML